MRAPRCGEGPRTARAARPGRRRCRGLPALGAHSATRSLAGSDAAIGARVLRRGRVGPALASRATSNPPGRRRGVARLGNAERSVHRPDQDADHAYAQGKGNHPATPVDGGWQVTRWTAVHTRESPRLRGLCPSGWSRWLREDRLFRSHVRHRKPRGLGQQRRFHGGLWLAHPREFAGPVRFRGDFWFAGPGESALRLLRPRRLRSCRSRRQLRFRSGWPRREFGL
jgi:hypothetical protein